jgi:ABC-type branched-subunit amino acid transport system substrate-binding protein
LLGTCLLVLAALLGGCVAQRVAAPPPPPQASTAVAPPQAIAPSVTPSEAPPPVVLGEKMKIALLLPLSGPTGGLGRAMLDAAQMALFEVADDNFVLVPLDTQGTAEGATRAAESAVSQGAEFILGPLLAGEVAAVKPIARNANLSMVAFSTDEQLAGDGTYLLGFPPRQSVDRIAAFAHEKGVTRLAALAPSTPYGQLVVDELRSAAAAQGSRLDHVEFYDPSATDLRPVVRRLAGQAVTGEPDFDAVLLPEGGAKLKAVVSLLPYFDIDPAKVHILGTGLWDEPGLGSEPALVGAWFAAPAPAGRADFEKRFQAAYKQAPPRLASLGYDATALAAILAQRPRGTGFTAAALTDPSGFVGVDGIFRFRSDGRADRGLAVLQIERAGRTVISPAPETFERPAS